MSETDTTPPDCETKGEDVTASGLSLDRTISISVLIMLLVQFATGFWWAGAAAQRLDHLENQMTARSAVFERLARLEAQMDETRIALQRLDGRPTP